MKNRLLDAIDAVVSELQRATEKHQTPMRSPHEGYGIIAEEFDEFFDAVKANDPAAQRAEVIQVAAMCLRFLIDLK